MALRVITGRANAGKTGQLYPGLVEAAQDGRAAVLLLPTFPDVDRAREEFAIRAPIGVRIATFDGWVDTLWALYGDGRTIAGAMASAAVMTRVCAESSSAFGRVSERPGFVTLMAAVAGRIVSDPECSDRTAEAVAELCGRYRSELQSQGLIERTDAMLALARSCPLSGAEIAVNRFTDFSPAQTKILSALSAANNVTVALTWEHGQAATEVLGPQVEGLLASGATHVHIDSPEPLAELQHIEARLFAPKEALVPTGHVTLMEAAGSEAEVALVARAARELIESGIPPEDIAVTFRDLAPRASLLETAFHSEGISGAFDLALPMHSTAYGRSVLALMRTVSGIAEREDFLTFLMSAYSGAATDDVQAADAKWRKARTVQPSSWLRDAQELSEATGSAIRAARSANSASKGTQRAEAWQQLAAVLVDNAWASERSSLESRIDAACYRAIVSGVSEATQVKDGRTPIDFLHSLAVSTVATGARERAGHVLVTEVHRLRARRFEALIVGGLTAAEFSSEKREPLAADLLRRIGQAAGADERLSERFLFYNVVTRPRQRLVLVRQATDAAGQELRPSVFWEEVVDLYRSADDVAEGRPSALQAHVKLPLGRLDEAAPVYTRGRRNARTMAQDGLLKPPTVLRGGVDDVAALLGGRAVFSSTEIEAYYSCPYRWFYDRVIRPQEMDRVFDVREKGSYAHRLLKEFYDVWAPAHGRVTPETLTMALECFDELVTGEARRPQAQGLQEEIELATAQEWARGVVEQDAGVLPGFAPVAHEWRFGGEGEPAFDLGGVALRGSIDRIDEGPAIAITDYKSSKNVSGWSDFQKDGRIQAIVYALAADAHFSKPLAGSVYRSLASGDVAGFWMPAVQAVEEWVEGKDLVSEEQWKELRKWATTVVVEATQGMREGKIAPEPRLKNSCEYCGARAMCKEVR